MSDTRHAPLTASEVATLVEHARTYDDNTGVDMGPRSVWASTKLIRRAGIEIGRLRSDKADLLAACELCDRCITEIKEVPRGWDSGANRQNLIFARGDVRAAIAKAKEASCH